MIDFERRLKGGIVGSCLGDALGVPVEFKSRQDLKLNPVNEMIGYGTYMQPPGTWSDDSSMQLCTMESLCQGYDLKDIANNFIKWRYDSFWTPYGIVFDIGIATTKAIIKLTTKKNPQDAGNTDERSNGNGSLMRILPIAYYLHIHQSENSYKIISDVSSITHAHIRSILSCYIYVKFAFLLLKGIDKFEAYKQLIEMLNDFMPKLNVNHGELLHFKRVLKGNIASLSENQISSSGYVIDSLESSFWSFLNTSSYSDAVLKSVNLGGDTDTTAAITGGLAGLYYGYDALPADWIKKLARINDITKLVDKFYNSLVT
jgi:ADP-ribosyl-[dinitrogen reductase] hydrolase